jgi:hypothetical protein
MPGDSNREDGDELREITGDCVRLASDAKLLRKRMPNLCELRVANSLVKLKNALIYWALIAHGPVDRSRGSLVRRDPLIIYSTSRAVLRKATSLFKGLQFEACVPPRTFCSPNHSSGRGTDIELKLYLGGSSAV